MDLTDVPIADGEFRYTAFVIDAFAGLIAGWRVAGHQKNNISDSKIRKKVITKPPRNPGAPRVPGQPVRPRPKNACIAGTTDKQR